MTARLLAALLLVLAGLLMLPAPAYACDYNIVPVEEHLKQADVVFTGTITKDEVNQNSQIRRITFAVDKVYKGTATATQVLTTHSSGASCGLEITGPGPFLVFALQNGSGLTSHLGGGTRAGPAPTSFGPGQSPAGAYDPMQKPDAAPPASQGKWIPLVGFVLAATAAAVVGLSLIRQRPR